MHWVTGIRPLQTSTPALKLCWCTLCDYATRLTAYYACNSSDDSVVMRMICLQSGEPNCSKQQRRFELSLYSAVEGHPVCGVLRIPSIFQRDSHSLSDSRASELIFVKNCFWTVYALVISKRLEVEQIRIARNLWCCVVAPLLHYLSFVFTGEIGKKGPDSKRTCSLHCRNHIQKHKLRKSKTLKNQWVDPDVCCCAWKLITERSNGDNSLI